MNVDGVNIGPARAREIERVAAGWMRGQVQAADIAAYVLGVKARRVARRAVLVGMQRHVPNTWRAAACIPHDQSGQAYSILADVTAWVTDEDVAAVRAMLGRVAA